MRDQNDIFDPTQANELRRSADQVTGSLDAGAQAGNALAEALQRARAAGKALAATSSKVRRILAGFDQINRLGTAKSSGSSSRKSSKSQKTQEQAQQLREDVDTVLEQLNPLETPAIGALTDQLFSLSAIMEYINQLGKLLQQLRQNVLVPLGSWIGNTLAPAFSQLLSQGINLARQHVTLLTTRITQLQQMLHSVANQIGQGFLWALQQLGQGISDLVTAFFTGSTQIGSSTAAMHQSVTGASAGMRTALQSLQTLWQQVTNGIQTNTARLSAGVTGALEKVLSFLGGNFTKKWTAGFTGLKTPVKGVINGIIGLLNRLLAGLSGALNAVVRAANQLKFKVPEWVPGIGGQQYGISMKTVSVPQIPYLARGAVLPANQPFLAVVGDQRHGTNVEAPLATIQEAVAAVMADHTAGNMAGHEATVAVLRQILEAVLGIEIGDAAIARAAQSYRLKNAVMKGGSL